MLIPYVNVLRVAFFMLIPYVNVLRVRFCMLIPYVNVLRITIPYVKILSFILTFLCSPVHYKMLSVFNVLEIIYEKEFPIFLEILFFWIYRVCKRKIRLSI